MLTLAIVVNTGLSERCIATGRLAISFIKKNRSHYVEVKQGKEVTGVTSHRIRN